MSPSSRIQVLVRHRDPISRAGLQSAFSACPDFELVDGDLPDHADVRSPEADTRADIVVADYEEAMDIAARTHGATCGGSSQGLIVVTASDREVDIRQAMEKRIRGYLLLGCELEELAAAVREVYRGGRYLSAPVAQRLAESMGAEPLTPRESEVLLRLVSGMGNKDIARKLDIGVGTVKSHLKTIFAKLGVASRTQAVAATERRGLLRATSAQGVERTTTGRSISPSTSRYAAQPYASN